MRVGEFARRTGVGQNTLRAWERRFGFLQPERSAGGQRLYTDADVEAVAVVRRLVNEGLTLAAAVSRVRTAATSLPPGETEALFLHQLVQAANQGIWAAQMGRTRFVNRYMAEMLRCSVDDILAASVFDFIHPDYVALVEEKGRSGLAGRRDRFEVVLVRADGTSFPAEVSTSPLHAPGGAYEGAVAVVRDITARKEALAEARFRGALLDAVGEAVAAATPDGAVTYLNAAAERLFGWRAIEVVGKNGVAMFIAPESEAAAPEIVATLLDGKPYAGEMRMVRRDGTKFAARLNAARVVDDAGELIGLIGVFSDLTVPLRLERQLRASELQAETVAVLGARARGRDAAGRDAVLAESLEAVRRLLDTERAAILDVSPEGADLVVRASSPASDTATVVPSGSRSLAGYAALVRSVVVVEDAAREKRFEVGRTAAGPTMGAALAAPVFGSDGVRAVVTTETSSPRPFTSAEGHFLLGIANVVGVALDASAPGQDS